MEKTGKTIYKQLKIYLANPRSKICDKFTMKLKNINLNMMTVVETYSKIFLISCNTAWY